MSFTPCLVKLRWYVFLAKEGEGDIFHMVFIYLLWSCTQCSALKNVYFVSRNKIKIKYCLFMA